MADTFWGIDPGQSKANVTEASTTQSTKIEVRADTTISEKDIIRSLEVIIAVIKESKTHPA